jgi:predicted PurR-regulated permease PerM
MVRARNSLSPLLTLAALVVAVAALHLAKEILLPIALAILVSFLLTPLCNRLESFGFSRLLSVITVVSVTFAALGLLTWVVMSQLVDLGSQLPSYKSTLIRKINQIKPESSTISEITETIEDVQKSIAKEKPPSETETRLVDGSATDSKSIKRNAEEALGDSGSMWSWARI